LAEIFAALNIEVNELSVPFKVDNLKRTRKILFNQVKSGQLVSDQNKVTWNLIIKGVVSRDEYNLLLRVL
jgi:hypothetical protein